MTELNVPTLRQSRRIPTALRHLPLKKLRYLIRYSLKSNDVKGNFVHN